MLLSSSFIAAQLNSPCLSRVYVGYSGGVDSHVLLHLCASIVDLKHKITAVYVHHGLQPEADNWAKHCQHTACELGIDFKMLRVDASPKHGESPEEAARNARYTALKALIDVDCALLVAQHREDQLETVLLQLFRGGGLRGLSGMPETMAFGQGVLLRPLLNVAKQDIDDYARVQQLRWIEDPSNAQNDYDRNYLRNDILPLLKQRWPALDKTVSRSAAHCASAEILITQIARQWFSSVFNADDNTLLLSQLQAFEASQQQHIIRAWFQQLALKMPAQAFVQRIFQEVIHARQNSDPILAGQGISIRRYRDKLYCLKHSPQPLLADFIWPNTITSIALGDNRTLSCVPASSGIPVEYWRNAKIVVRFRVKCEKISLPARVDHHSLKNLFQEAGIPPWDRLMLPFIYLDDKLAAVGDKWISSDFYSETNESIRLVLRALQ
ncbi:tRNA lysidine(34) synthetase TilS [Crenothrix sp.]|uniref:tRNA lysidine(34) synthetase TilS n=1 Tax=Crenothrix sp. TaxID=3100433 RepID=UPI00374D1D14